MISTKIHVLDLARQVRPPHSEHHYQRQRLHQYRRSCLLQGDRAEVRLLPGAELQRGHRRSDLRHPQKHLRAVYTAGPAGEEAGNC